MKVNRKWTILNALILVFLLVPVSAWAQQFQGAGPRGARGKAHFFRMAALFKDLGLTAEQKDQLKNVMTAYKPEMKSTAKENFTARKALQEVMQANPENPTAWQSSFKQATDAEWNGLLLRERIRKDILKLLTPEQMAKLDAKRKEFYSRLGRFLDR